LIAVRRLFDTSSVRLIAISASMAISALGISFGLIESTALTLGLGLTLALIPAKEIRNVSVILFPVFGFLQVGLVTNNMLYAFVGSVGGCAIVGILAFFSTQDDQDQGLARVSFVWNRFADLALLFAVVLINLGSQTQIAYLLLLFFFLIRGSLLICAQFPWMALQNAPFHWIVLYYFAFAQMTLRLLFLADPHFSQTPWLWMVPTGVALLLSLATLFFSFRTRLLVANFFQVYSALVVMLMLAGFGAAAKQIYLSAYVLFPIGIFFANRLPSHQKNQSLWRGFLLGGIDLDRLVQIPASFFIFVFTWFVRQVFLPLLYFFFIMLPSMLNVVLRFSVRFLHNGNAQRVLTLFLICLCVFLLQFLGEA